MKDCKVKSEVTVLGIDLAKQSFQLHGVDKTGQTAKPMGSKTNGVRLHAVTGNQSSGLKSRPGSCSFTPVVLWSSI